MKKQLALVVLITMISGCAGNSLLCRNKTTITNVLNGVIVGANALILILPEASPVVKIAEQAIQMAQADLQKACPTVTDVQAAQAQLNLALTQAQASGYKVNRK